MILTNSKLVAVSRLEIKDAEAFFVAFPIHADFSYRSDSSDISIATEIFANSSRTGSGVVVLESLPSGGTHSLPWYLSASSRSVPERAQTRS
jgi:hypothetical protein